MKVRLLLLAVTLFLACMPFACDCEEEATYVQTLGAYELHAGHASLTGYLDTMLGASTVQVWFELTDPAGLERTTSKQTVTAVGEFSLTLDESWLTPGSYKFSAHAKGDNWGREYQGEKLPFTIP